MPWFDFGYLIAFMFDALAWASAAALSLGASVSLGLWGH